jgi:hypothetical protein
MSAKSAFFPSATSLLASSVIGFSMLAATSSVIGFSGFSAASSVAFTFFSIGEETRCAAS